MTGKQGTPWEVWPWWKHPKAREIFAICRKLIAGESRLGEATLSVIDLLDVMWPRHQNLYTRDFDFFREVNLFVQEIPFGAGRQNWAEEALVRKDAQLLSFEVEHHSKTVSEARRLLQYEPLA